MKQCMTGTVLAIVFLWSSTLAAQQAVTIKLKERDEGTTVLITKYETGTSTVKLEDGQGKVLLNQDEKFSNTSEYKETIVKREAKKPASRLERVYTKSLTKKGAMEDSSLEGKTVLIERNGESYTFKFKDGEAVQEPAASSLLKEFSHKSDSDAEMEKLMLPKAAVNVGDSWKLEMEPILKKIAQDGEMQVHPSKATGSGKLLKTYQKDGKQYGLMKFTMEVPLKTIGKGGQIKFMDGAKANMNILLDVCIDGTSETGSWKMKMNVNGNGTIAQAPGAVMTILIDSEVTETQKELPK